MTQYRASALVQAVTRARRLNHSEADSTIRTACEDVLDFGRIILEEFENRLHGDAGDLADLLLTGTKDHPSYDYQLEVPIPAIKRLVNALEVLREAYDNSFDDLYYVAMKNWVDEDDFEDE